MTLKTFTLAMILTIAPFAVAAQCSHGGGEQQAMSCIQGTEFDAESGTCVPVATT